MFALIKRVGVKDENLASLFYSILLFTNILTLSLFFKFTVKDDVYSALIFKGTGAGIFLIIYYCCKHYFINTKNYMRMINKYEDKYPDKKIRMAIIGIVYSILTFFGFPFTVYLLSNMSYNIR